jgi:hypothetical protein
MTWVAVICRLWCVVMLRVCAALGWWLAGCQPAPEPASPKAPPGSPAPPRPSITGCVESDELKPYVLALEARRSEARGAALTALGARVEARAAVFASGGTPLGLDQTFEANGKRWVVAAQVAAGFAPAAPLAAVGQVIYRLQEHPRALPSPVLACGVQRCSPEQHIPAVPLPVRPVLVELQPGERWAGPLVVSYDYARADVRYDRAEPCAPAAAPASPEPQPRASSAASATP